MEALAAVTALSAQNNSTLLVPFTMYNHGENYKEET